MSKQTISLCMIVKNEEKFLEQCLNSAKDIADEIIIVDTGSTDKTKEIALSFGAKIYDFKWCDDFSAARNECLKHATKDWVLVLDADEKLDESAKEKIKEVIEREDVYGFSMPQLNYTNKYTTHPNFVPINNSKFKGYFVIYIIRLFRRSKEIYFQFYVHEMVDNTILKANKKIESLNVPIYHYQELKGVDYVDNKQQSYKSLLTKNINDYPEEAIHYNHLAVLCNTYKKDIKKAIEYVQKAIELEPKNIEYQLHLSCLLNEIGEYNKSIECLKEAIQIEQDERLYRALGIVYYKLEKYNNSIESYKRALELGTPLKKEVMEQIKYIKKKMNESAYVSYSFSLG